MHRNVLRTAGAYFSNLNVKIVRINQILVLLYLTSPPNLALIQKIIVV